jgi:hypothetical protein
VRHVDKIAGSIIGVRVKDRGTVNGVTGTFIGVTWTTPGVTGVMGTMPGVTGIMGMMPGVTGIMGTMPGVRVESAGTVNRVRGMGTILGDMGTIPGVTGVIAVCPSWKIFPMDPEGLIGVVLAVRLAPECAVCVYVYVLVYVSKLDSVCDIGVWRFDLEE